MADAYLREHLGKHYKQYRSGRRATPTGLIVLHTFEAPVWTTAIRGAEIIRTMARQASYHRIGDADRNEVQVVRYSDEAWHDGTGSNRYSIGISLMMRAKDWPNLKASEREALLATMVSMAVNAAAWLKDEHGIVVPARRVSKTQSNAGAAGFISHGQRDPSRRSDPGDGFPWTEFLARFADSSNQPKGNTVPSKITFPGSRDATIRRIQEAVGFTGDDVDGDPFTRTAEAAEALAVDRDKYSAMAHEYDGRIKDLQKKLAATEALLSEKTASLTARIGELIDEKAAAQAVHDEQLASIQVKTDALNARIAELETNEVALTNDDQLALATGQAFLNLAAVIRGTSG